MPPPSRKPGQTPKIISVASKASPQRQPAAREDIDIDEPPIEESTDFVLIKSQPVEDDEVTGESQENLKRKATGKDHLSKCIDLTVRTSCSLQGPDKIQLLLPTTLK